MHPPSTFHLRLHATLGWLLPLVLSLMITGCVRSHFNLATQREEYSVTSTEKEIAVGRQIAQDVERELPLSDDATVQERVAAIGARLAAVCDRRELVYQFQVLQDKEVNAFSLPGGFVFVHEGLVQAAANDDELAAVIAHEVAHITTRHAVKRYESSLGLQLAQLAALLAKDSRAASSLGLGLRSTQLAYARQDELEADRVGVKYMRAAGFDPKGMLAFLEKLHTITHDKTQYLPRQVIRPHYAMTHPYVSDRIRAVKETLYGVADYLDYLNTPN